MSCESSVSISFIAMEILSVIALRGGVHEEARDFGDGFVFYDEYYVGLFRSGLPGEKI